MSGSSPRLFPSTKRCCRADVTRETAIIRIHPYDGVPRGMPPVIKKAKQIHHVRYLEGEYPEGHELAGVRIAERFWHWSDQEVSGVEVFSASFMEGVPGQRETPIPESLER